MELDTNFTMDGKNEDLFFLSNGHISPVIYSVLARRGYFPVEELNTFRLLDSRLQGHPTTHEGLPGVRIASGSLGQGMSVALGAAQAKKLNNDSKLVYILHGDGELQEGQNWEAIMYASAKKVDNLIATIDLNGQQIDGSTDDVLAMGSLKAKFEAFGWIVLEVKEGNNLEAIVNGLKEVKSKEIEIVDENGNLLLAGDIERRFLKRLGYINIMENIIFHILQEILILYVTQYGTTHTGHLHIQAKF